MESINKKKTYRTMFKSETNGLHRHYRTCKRCGINYLTVARNSKYCDNCKKSKHRNQIK